ncbi:CHAT domain-containing protein [Lewinella sp. JB7]|uniref:CHAT domain-containing protein n=1 Tax=Lewinella sp. JB7 TaxID=2962887 RepID=UPI0020C9C263|nr:CHAT domain-containing protein [Lewinella sp. JB7]MCP9237698.1 CHAT domain-containing protein [Lewinella sp. JB7]
MKPRPWLLLPLLVCALYGCFADRPPAGPSPTDLRVSDSLAAIRTAYRDLQLPEALTLGRRLRTTIDTLDQLADPLRAETYQYLALLHFERGVHPDSVARYTGMAEALLTDDAPNVLRARQLLCRAQVRHDNREWLEVDMTTRLGQLLLEGTVLRDTVLYGQLLLLQGFARKKYADFYLEGGEKRHVLEGVEQIFRQALRLYREMGSPRERQAWDELVILQTRFPDRDVNFAATIDSLRAVGDLDKPVYGYPERLYGYWHHHRDRPDSARVAYRRFVEYYPVYVQQYVNEANYILWSEAVSSGDYTAAFDLLVDEMGDLGCCVGDSRTFGPADPPACPQPLSCIYLMVAQARTHLLRYEQVADPEDLRLAYALSRHALAGYEGSFSTLQEEAVLNKIFEIGRRLLDISLEASFAVAERDPSPEHLQQVFEAIERGKSFLLTRDAVTARQDETRDALRQLQASITLAGREYVRRFDLPVADLERYQQLTLEHQTLERRRSAQPDPLTVAAAVNDSALRLPAARAKLDANQALLEYANTAGATFGLYADRDTTIVFRVDPSHRALSDSLARWLADRTPVAVTAYDSLAHALYRQLLGPVAEQLAHRSSLLVAPSATLNDLPFSALTTTRSATARQFSDLHYVLDEFSIRYLPSWRVEERYRAARTVRTDGPPAIGVWTNPDLNAYLKPLGDYLIDRTRAANDHFTDRKCTTATLTDRSTKYDILHLSVHARGNPTRLYDNYLYLGRRDSLNGVTITGLNLPARLVVLAACSTGRGYASRGEGTLSLRRSFHLAGVPDVVCSLYDIPAPATAGLLRSFYDRYFNDGSLTGSLTEAQRDCRHQRLDPRWGHPHYWAGIIAG